MTESNNARPPQVTMAGWVTIVGSVFVVFNLFETVGNLRSLETRERVSSMLSEPPLEGTGLDLDQWLSFIHVVSLVAAACAVSAAILGAYALRRSTSARVGLSVVAPPLFLSGMVTSSGFMSTLVAVSVLMLWTKPSRDWFAGRPWVPQTSPSRLGGGRGRDLEDPSSPQPPTPGPAPWEPKPHRPEPEAGQQPPPPPWGPPGSGDRPMPPTGDARPHEAFGAVTPRPVVPVGRPPALVTACILTWVFAGVVAVGCLLAVLGAALVPEALEDQVSSQDLSEAGVTAEQLRQFVLGMGVLFGVWALVAVVLAIFTFLGRPAAWVALLISSGFAAAAFAVGAAGSGLAGLMLLLPVIACVATLTLLLRPEVRAWMGARSVR